MKVKKIERICKFIINYNTKKDLEKAIEIINNLNFNYSTFNRFMIKEVKNGLK